MTEYSVTKCTPAHNEQSVLHNVYGPVCSNMVCFFYRKQCGTWRSQVASLSQSVLINVRLLCSFTLHNLALSPGSRKMLILSSDSTYTTLFKPGMSKQWPGGKTWLTDLLCEPSGIFILFFFQEIALCGILYSIQSTDLWLLAKLPQIPHVSWFKWHHIALILSNNHLDVNWNMHCLTDLQKINFLFSECMPELQKKSLDTLAVNLQVRNNVYTCL